MWTKCSPRGPKYHGGRGEVQFVRERKKKILFPNVSARKYQDFIAGTQPDVATKHERKRQQKTESLSLQFFPPNEEDFFVVVISLMERPVLRPGERISADACCWRAGGCCCCCSYRRVPYFPLAYRSPFPFPISVMHRSA